MYQFTYHDLDGNKIEEKNFDSKPTYNELTNFIYDVDVGIQKDAMLDLLEASGEDIYFSAEDDYGNQSDGFYACLKKVD